QLENCGHEVIVPTFPIEDYTSFSEALKNDPLLKPTNQNLDNWLKTFKPYLKQIDEQTIFVAHSIAPAFVLHLLQRLEGVKVRASFFVSGFLGRIGIPEYDAVNASFVDGPFDWVRIKQACREFYVISSDNDPYVPYALTEDLKARLTNYLPQEGTILANYLNAKFELIPGGQHLNTSAGYSTFLYLFTLINKVILSGGRVPASF
ncbi:MAG TPA: alpha/beta hydrolase, partial [bacterium]|nr:alpha/beta hydrolase [bacterium]